MPLLDVEILWMELIGVKAFKGCSLIQTPTHSLYVALNCLSFFKLEFVTELCFA